MAKNNGPSLISVFKGGLSLIPERWRAKLGVTRTVTAKDKSVAPDTLSSSIVGSSAEAVNTDERKVTKEELGSPSGVSLSEQFLTEDGTIATRVGSLVEEGTELPVPSHKTEDARQQNLGTGYLDQSVATSADYDVRQGQFYDDTEDVVIPFTEQIVGAGEGIGDAKTEVLPLNDLRYKKRVYVPDEDAILALSWQFESTVDLNLPDVLTGIEVVWNISKGEGSSSFPTIDMIAIAVGTSGSAGVDPRAQAQSSISLMPEIIPTIETIWAQNVPTRHLVFFLPDNSSAAAVKTKCQTILSAVVNTWPTFKPKPLTFVLKGEQLNLSANASSHARLSFSESSKSAERTTGGGSSYDTGVTNKVVRLPPTLHAAFNLTGGTSKTETINVTVNASTVKIEGTGTAAGSVAAKDNIITINGTVEGSVTPTTVSATSPAAVPASGWYLYKTNSERWKYGYSMFHCILIDASKFAA